MLYLPLKCDKNKTHDIMPWSFNFDAKFIIMFVAVQLGKPRLNSANWCKTKPDKGGIVQLVVASMLETQHYTYQPKVANMIITLYKS